MFWEALAGFLDDSLIAICTVWVGALVYVLSQDGPALLALLQWGLE